MYDVAFRSNERRVVGCLVIIGHFLPKSSITSGSFAENEFPLYEVAFRSNEPRVRTDADFVWLQGLCLWVGMGG